MCLYAYFYFLDSKTGETANKRQKGAKNSATAAKVALMKLKMHADGDKSLPQVGLRDFEKQDVYIQLKPLSTTPSHLITTNLNLMVYLSWCYRCVATKKWYIVL